MSARTMDRLERVCLRKNEMSERRWQRRRAKWQRASLGNQEESDGGEGTAAGIGVGAGGAPHAEGGRRKEEKGAPGFKARRRGCLRCVVRSWADERGCPGHGAEGKTDRHQLGLDGKRPGRGSPLSGLIPSVSCLWRKRGPGRRDCLGSALEVDTAPGHRPRGNHQRVRVSPPTVRTWKERWAQGSMGKIAERRKGPPPGRGDTLEAGRVRPSQLPWSREKGPHSHRAERVHSCGRRAGAVHITSQDFRSQSQTS